jgi:hypothetical protein
MIGGNITDSPVEGKGYKRMIKMPDRQNAEKTITDFVKLAHRPVFYSCIIAPF